MAEAGTYGQCCHHGKYVLRRPWDDDGSGRCLRSTECRLLYRGELYAQQDGICPWCMEALPLDQVTGQTIYTRRRGWVSVDHVIPRIRGGPDLHWNLQLLHYSCNQAKGERIVAYAMTLATANGFVLPGFRPVYASGDTGGEIHLAYPGRDRYGYTTNRSLCRRPGGPDAEGQKAACLRCIARAAKLREVSPVPGAVASAA